MKKQSEITDECEGCEDLKKSPILVGLLEETFHMDTNKVILTYHQKSHSLFGERKEDEDNTDNRDE